MKWQRSLVEGFSFPSPGTSSPLIMGVGLGLLPACSGSSVLELETVSKILGRSWLSETWLNTRLLVWKADSRKYIYLFFLRLLGKKISGTAAPGRKKTKHRSHWDRVVGLYVVMYWWEVTSQRHFLLSGRKHAVLANSGFVVAVACW